MPDFSWGPGCDYPGGGSPSSSSDNPRKLSLGCHPDSRGRGGRSAEGKAPFSAFGGSPIPIYGWRRGAPPPVLYNCFVDLAVDRKGCLANTLTRLCTVRASPRSSVTDVDCGRQREVQNQVHLWGGTEQQHLQNFQMPFLLQSKSGFYLPHHFLVCFRPLKCSLLLLTWKDWKDFIWWLERARVLWIRFCSTRKCISATLRGRGGKSQL